MIKRSATKKNPYGTGSVSTKIEPRGKNFQISIFAGPTRIIRVENIPTRKDAEKINTVIKKTLKKELKSTKKSNPSNYELEGSFKKAIGSSMGLPDDKREAFELGRLYGIQVCLKQYSGALSFFQRRKVLKAVDDAISNSLGHLARTVLVRGEGIEGPIPIVTKRTKS